MRPILIAITRQTRAERPSEATLDYIYQQTAAAAMGGLLGSPEDHVTDTFIKTFPRRGGNAGISLEVERVMQSRYAPIHPKVDDGVCVYEYPYDGGSGRTVLKSKTFNDVVGIDPDTEEEIVEEITVSEVVQVRVTMEDSSDYQEFQNYADARTFVDALHGSDGYVMIGEFKNKSEVLESRPNLWNEPDRILPLLQSNRYVDRQDENDRH